MASRVGSRDDCEGLYKVHLTLENRKHEVIGYQSMSGETAGGAGWGKVSVNLIIPEGSERLMREARYLTVQNEGKTDQFWAGCHGTKFSRISVFVRSN